MRHLPLFLYLGVLLFTISCKPDPQTETIDYKRTDNSVVVRIEADAERLNPLLTNTSYSVQVAEQLNLYLINYNPVAGNFVPELVRSIPESRQVESGPYAGKLAYEFEILDEAVWSDGSPVTGADYLFTIKAIFNPLVESLRYRAVLTGEIADIVVDEENPKKFTVYSDNQTISGLETISNTIPVAPEYLYDPDGLLRDIPLSDLLDEAKAQDLAENNTAVQDFAARINAPEYSRNPAYLEGSGPYQLVEWQTGQSITLRKKTDWWGDQIDKSTHPTLTALPEEIIFKPIPNPTTALAALKSEEIDVMNRIQTNEFEALKEDSIAGQRYQLSAISSMAHYFLALNTEDPKLADKRVRRALALAMDVDEVIEKVYLGYGERLAAPVHPSQPYYNKELPILRQNIEQAKELLAEAGWTDTNNNGIVDKEIEGERVELSLEVLMSETESTRNSMLLFQDQVRRAGIDLELKPSPTQVLLGNWRSKQFEIASVGRTITPNWNPKQSWHTTGANYSGFGNADTDELIDRIILTLDTSERYELYKDLQTAIYEEQPHIYLFAPETPIAIHNRFDFKPFAQFPGYQPRFFKLKDNFQS